MRDIATKADNVGDVLTAGDFNALSDELENAVTDSGLSLDPAGGPDTDTNMLGKSISAYAVAGQYFDDAGAADAYVVTRPTNLQEVPLLTDGMIVVFAPANTNTGASTLQVSGLTAKSITYANGDALTAGAIVSGRYCSVRYDLGNDRFEMIFGNGIDMNSTYLNTVVGENAGLALDGAGGGIRNTLMGYNAGIALAQADSCTCVGRNAGLSLVNDEDGSTFIGAGSGQNIVGANALYNTMVGSNCGENLVNAQRNTFVGRGVAASGTPSTQTASFNVALGVQCLSELDTGPNNVAIGYQAGLKVTSASDSVLIGYSAGSGITSNGNNVVIGGSACTGSAYTGIQGIFIGGNAGGSSATTADENIGIGHQALGSLTSGDSNTCVGDGSGIGITSTSENTLVGKGTGVTSGLGTGNVAIGFQGLNVCTGTGNTALGYKAGNASTSSDYNVLIGYLANLDTATDDHKFILESDVAGTGGRLMDGDFSTGIINFNSNVYSNTPSGTPSLMVMDSNGEIGTSNADSAPVLDESGTTGTLANLDGARGVHVQGNYAYVASSNTADSLTVIDITDPTDPTEVGSVTSANLDGALEVYVSGNYAYVTANAVDALTVIDISDPTTPTEVGSITSTNLDGAYGLYVSGNYAYVCANVKDALTVINISDPSNPVEVGSTGTLTNLNGATDVHVQGNYAYVSAYSADRLTVVDISDPTTPTEVGSITSTNLDGALGVYVSGNYAYVCATDGDRFTVIDITDPSSPAYLGSITNATILNGISNVHISGNYAYVTSLDGDRLSVIDITDPTSLSIVDNYTSSSLNGARGVYVSGNYAYVTAQNYDALTVMSIGGLTLNQAEIGTIKSNNIESKETIQATDINAKNGMMVGPHGLNSEGPVYGKIETMIVEEQATSGTAGGTFTSGTWETRGLDQVVYNTIDGASLTGDEITLPAGTYRVHAWGTAYSVDGHMTRFEDITEPSFIAYGSSANSGSSNTQSVIDAVFSIDIESDFVLSHRCETTQTTNGFGLDTGLGTEVYARVILEKIG